MAKKYSPSGYQIINLDLSDKTKNVAFTPETDDEKLLYELINKRSDKIILLKVNDFDSTLHVGFCVMENTFYGFLYGTIGSFMQLIIEKDGTKLKVSYLEE